MILQDSGMDKKQWLTVANPLTGLVNIKNKITGGEANVPLRHSKVVFEAISALWKTTSDTTEVVHEEKKADLKAEKAEKAKPKKQKNKSEDIGSFSVIDFAELENAVTENTLIDEVFGTSDENLTEDTIVSHVDVPVADLKNDEKIKKPIVAKKREPKKVFKKLEPVEHTSVVKVTKKPAKKAKVTKSSKTPPLVTVKFAPASGVIVDEGFKIQLVSEDPNELFNIIKDNGDIIGEVHAVGDRKLTIKPSKGEDFKASSHTGMIGVVSKIYSMLN
jgi:hypothetical protein